MANPTWSKTESEPRGFPADVARVDTRFQVGRTSRSATGGLEE